MQAFFKPPAYAELANVDVLAGAGAAFAAWYRHNTVAHRQPGYRAVVVSLKKPGVPPGDATSAQLDGLADLADRYSFGEVRVTHDQNVVLADVPQRELHAVRDALEALGLATPNIGTLNDMICCPGLDFCGLANATSIPVAKAINERFSDLDYLYDLGEIQIKMSGCMNACGHHHVGHIGILGVDRKGEEHYQVQIGGSASEDAALGKILGRGFSAAEVVDVVEKIVETYLALRRDGETFIQTYRRVGQDPFKERVYGAH